MSPTLNPNEIDALMQAIRSGPQPEPETAERGKVVSYDLTSQDRIIRGQMPTLDAINDVVASRLAVGLQGRLRTQVRASAQPASLLKFADFNALLAPPATVAVLTLGSGHGMALAVLDANLTRALLVGALGDKRLRPDGATPPVRRELTAVEKQVLRRLLTLLTDAMEAAWGPILALKPDVVRFESDPRLAVIAAPNDVAILSTLELDIGGALNGTLQLGLPYASVEAVKKQLSSPPRSGAGSNQRFVQALATELQAVEVLLVAELGRARLNVSRMMELRVGDVLTLDTYEGGKLGLRVQGRQKFLGEPTVQHGRMAFAIQQDAPTDLPRDDAGTPVANNVITEQTAPRATAA
ncbi:MAG: FliM/FliN family flagellar motor switch protein [Myxococcota bacterium]